MTLEKLSFSSYKEYTDCGEKWRLKRVDKVPVPERPAAWLVAGQAYHSAVEQWENSARALDILELFDAAWNEELMGYVEAQPDFALWELTPRVKSVQRDLDLRLDKGRTWVRNYEIRADKEAEQWHIAHVGVDIGTEVSFEVEEQGILVRGYIDQVRLWNGQLVVVDLKTGNPGNTDPRQLGLYAWGMRKQYGLDVAFGRMFYAKLDDEPKSGDQMGRYGDWVDTTRYSDKFWTEQFRIMALGVKNGIYLPNVSDRCERCDVKSVCPAWVGEQKEETA